MAKIQENKQVYDKHRLTRREKNAKDQQWYKDYIDSFDVESSNNSSGYGGVSEYKRMKVNCDLFNNIIDVSDFAYVCTPFGAEVGELPASMVNRDITSYRIKALMGMEMKRPYSYKVLATNKEATTRREEEETSRIKEYVLDQIMLPIRQEAEVKYQEQIQGRQLTPQEKQQLQAQLEQEISSKTPDRVKKYMQRDHQDPSEVLGHQIMEYLSKEQDIRRKFSKGWKYALLTAYEVYWIGIINNKPAFKVINPIRFNCDKSPDIDFIEDCDWAVAEYRMPPSEVVKTFKLTNTEIDNIYSKHEYYSRKELENRLFTFKNGTYADEDGTIKVIHVQWKSLRKVGWLTYLDENDEIKTKFLVDEEYVLNKNNGDISIEWEWIPEVYEGYKIGTDIYKNMQPVPGQTKDINNIYKCKLSYHGAIYDNTNSQPTAPMDRMKVYQYYYNIVMYRLELLLASDKGKKVLMNINAIPESAGIDIEKWQYFFESSPFMWYNPDEEGMTQQDVNTVAKTIDLSLASDINRYIELAEYLEQKCGKSVGVTDPVLGQTSVSESVGNNQQNLIQTSHILEPYFALHNSIKQNVLNSLLDVAKIAYSNEEDENIVLDYILDDMSRQTLKVDIGLLDNSTLGIFFEDGAEAQEARDMIRQLAHAYAQNQAIEMSDVLAVMKEKGTQEAEEVLRASESKKQQREDAQAQAERDFKASEEQKKREEAAINHDREKELIVLKETERRKTVVQTQAMLSLGFNEDKDFDNDGQLDVMEIAKNATDANIRLMEQHRQNRELDHKIQDDKEKNSIAKSEIAAKKIEKSK